MTTVPDYPEPLVGYRGWRVDSRAGALRSLVAVDSKWSPWQPKQAKCLNAFETIPAPCERHVTQNMGCGIYAFKDMDVALDKVLRSDVIVGKVEMWGAVVEHDKGWRSEYAEITALYPTRKQLRKYRYIIATYADVGVPISRLPWMWHAPPIMRFLMPFWAGSIVGAVLADNVMAGGSFFGAYAGGYAGVYLSRRKWVRNRVKWLWRT